LTFRVSYVEEQAIQNLLEKFTANKNRLMKEFAVFDRNNTGKEGLIKSNLMLDF
jgi:hypothetical protein